MNDFKTVFRLPLGETLLRIRIYLFIWIVMPKLIKCPNEERPNLALSKLNDVENLYLQ